MSTSPDSGFDRVAFAYDFMARLVFGNAIKKAQTVFLGEIKTQSNILIIGGGTGWILEELSKLRIPLSITYIEASGSMLEKAKSRKLATTGMNLLNVDFIHDNESAIPSDVGFDMIMTPFFLDLFEGPRLEAVFSRLHQALKKGGSWFFSDFHVPRGIARPFSVVLIRSMYLFFRICCGTKPSQLPDFEQVFKKDQFLSVSKELFFLNMIQSHIYLKLTA